MHLLPQFFGLFGEAVAEKAHFIGGQPGTGLYCSRQHSTNCHGEIYRTLPWSEVGEFNINYANRTAEVL